MAPFSFQMFQVKRWSDESLYEVRRRKRYIRIREAEWAQRPLRRLQAVPSHSAEGVAQKQPGRDAMSELETIIWCPKCRELKGEILRIPTGQENVFTHKSTPDPLPKKCECGTVLERKQ